MQKTFLQSSFRNIYYSEGDKPVFCYRFGTTVYEEVFDSGRYVAAGWNLAGFTQNVLEGSPMRLPYDEFAEPQAFDLEIDGRTLSYNWKLKGFQQQEETEPNSGNPLLHGIVTLESGLLPVTVQVHTILDGTPILTRYLTVTNQGERSMNISMLSPMCGGLEVLPEWDEYLEGTPAPEKLYSLGYMESSKWGQEGLFRWHEMPNACYSICGKYRRDRHRHPMFMLKNNALGSFFYGQLGWTGGYELRFDLNAEDSAFGFERTDRKARIHFKAAIDSQKPLLVLNPGETFVSPSMHMGGVHGDLDDAVNAMHRHIRTSVFTLPDARGIKGWVEAGVGPERPMDFGAIKHIADTAAAVGAEAVIIDAGWNCPLGTEPQECGLRVGDWYADKEKYGEDFFKIREYVHSKGLLFGLWMDAERIGSASQVSKKHPDWIAEGYDGSRSTMLDMAKPEVAQWVEKEIERLIEQYQIDLFRLDYNISPTETCYKITQGDTTQCGALRYYQAVNSMYRNLRKKYPDVVFENCASGGGRTDLEFNSSFTHTWVSDWQLAPRSCAITNGMTMVLPPEFVDRLVSGMFCHIRGGLDFQVRHTLFGRPTTNSYNARGSQWNPGQIAFVKHSFDLYKSFIRSFIQDSKTYHHTPEIWGTQPKGTGILERASADGSKGIIGIFRLAHSNETQMVVYPKGLDRSKTYQVTFDNSGEKSIVSGYSLVNNGIRIHLDGALTSELVLYQAVE